MRNLNLEDIKNIEKEDIVQVIIDRINKKTTVIIAQGCVDQELFISMPGTEQRYEINGFETEKTDDEYWAEIDEQRRPSAIIYGLKYVAKKEGVTVKYESLMEDANGDPIAAPPTLVVVEAGLIFQFAPETTPNEDLIALIEASLEAQELIYIPKIIDTEAMAFSPIPECKIG